MQFRQTQLSQAVASAKQYFVTFASVLPRTIASGALQMLDQLVDGFRTQAGQQDTKTSDLRGEVAQKAVLQNALLRDHLAPIVAAARSSRSCGAPPTSTGSPCPTRHGESVGSSLAPAVSRER